MAEMTRFAQVGIPCCITEKGATLNEEMNKTCLCIQSRQTTRAFHHHETRPLLLMCIQKLRTNLKYAYCGVLSS